MRSPMLALLALLPLVTAAPAAAQLNALVEAASPLTPFKLIAANTNNATNLKPTPGRIEGIELGGIGAAPAYLKLYDKATTPTCGTDVPVKVLIIPAAATAANGAANNVTIPDGFSFLLGIGFCVVVGITDADNTAPAAATYIVNIDYR